MTDTLHATLHSYQQAHLAPHGITLVSHGDGDGESATVADLLPAARRVRDLLDAPEAWTRHAYSRDDGGKPANALGAAATCWSLVGAVWRESEGWLDVPLVARFRAAAGEDYGGPPAVGVQRWNDTPGRTHADVLALIDVVITDLEETS